MYNNIPRISTPLRGREIAGLGVPGHAFCGSFLGGFGRCFSRAEQACLVTRGSIRTTRVAMSAIPCVVLNGLVRVNR